MLPMLAGLSVNPPWARPITDYPGPVEHVLAFSICAFAFGVAYPHRLRMCAAGLTIVAALSEIAQLVAPGRHARVTDFAVDLIGIAAGISIAAIAGALLRRLPAAATAAEIAAPQTLPSLATHSR